MTLASRPSRSSTASAGPSRPSAWVIHVAFHLHHAQLTAQLAQLLALADIDEGEREGVTTILKKAAAFFATENVLGRQ
jgi:hypothetical protein